MYDIKGIGKKIQERRKNNNKQDPKKFDFCRTQQLLANKITSSNGEGTIDRRTLVNWENNKSTPNLLQFVELCECLDCDADYLLGKSDTPVKTISDISKFLGISEENVEAIKRNKHIQEMLDYFLSCGELKKIAEEIDNISLASHISGDILKAYSPLFKEKIREAYISSQKKAYSLDERQNNFKTELKKKFPYVGKNIGTLRQYLKDNIDKDEFAQILILSEYDNNNNEENLYNVFIDIIADFTFDSLMAIQINDFRMHNISQAFFDSLNRYIDSKVEKRGNLLKKAAKQILDSNSDS